MKKIIFIAVVALLSSCKQPAQSSQKHGNFQVELLFEKDGCKMYRFFDDRTVYWCNCEGSTQSSHQEGKIEVSDNVQTTKAK